jgi:hypothetical protein
MHLTEQSLNSWPLEYHNWLQFFPHNHVLLSPNHAGASVAHDPYHYLMDQWMAWLQEHCPDPNSYDTDRAGQIRFRNKKDAMHFKLRWSTGKGTGNAVGGIE